jgi:hypothetical protein
MTEYVCYFVLSITHWDLQYLDIERIVARKFKIGKLQERDLVWITVQSNGSMKVKFTLEQAMKAHRGCRDINLLFL